MGTSFAHVNPSSGRAARAILVWRKQSHDRGRGVFVMKGSTSGSPVWFRAFFRLGLGYDRWIPEFVSRVEGMTARNWQIGRAHV